MKRRNFTLLLMAATLLAFLLSLSAGKVWIAPDQWFSGYANGEVDGWIFLELRLPRALLGLAIGATLGLSGAVLQGYLRNPLADPTILGVSSTAALGGVTAISLGAGTLPFGIFGSAMAGAGLSVLLLMLLAGRGGSLGFILGGLVLSTLAGSLTAFLISISPNPYATSEIVAWLMGALTDRTMDDALLALPLMALGAVILIFTARSLDALSLGEAGAHSLGVNLRRLGWLIIFGVGLGVGASVAVAGIVGFVGLITPHLVRGVIGEQPSAILLPSALAGAILTLVADSFVRLTPGVSEIRLGIAMALLGAPFFLAIIWHYRREMA
ncbi:MAG: iron ABC transporter permease [Sphingorhabdus sp.]